MPAGLFGMTGFISTHALTWSATYPLNVSHNSPAISTHALTWSATCPSAPHQAAQANNFNSRTHVECDMSFPFPSRVR